MRTEIAARRTLRLALGTALCLLFSQAIPWPLSYIAPIITLMLLALPLPPLKLAQGIGFLAAMIAPLLLGLLLLPFLEHARWAGIGLVALALFYSFYYTARGGSPVLGTFMTIGLTLVVTVGSVAPTLLGLLLPGLSAAIACGIAFSWIGHACLPDPSRPASAMASKPPTPPKPDPATARRNALRSLFVVLPLALVFLFASGSPAFTPVMIKSAALGQEASVDQSRAMGRSLIASTVWGGLAAIVCWQVLAIWPSLPVYALLIALVCLLFGRWVFAGPALHPKASMASYALVTFIILLAPSVTDSPISSDAGSAFWSRLVLFVIIALYGTAAVRIFDTFWPRIAPSNAARAATG